jgi:hypothetical protein
VRVEVLRRHSPLVDLAGVDRDDPLEVQGQPEKPCSSEWLHSSQGAGLDLDLLPVRSGDRPSRQRGLARPPLWLVGELGVGAGQDLTALGVQGRVVLNHPREHPGGPRVRGMLCHLSTYSGCERTRAPTSPGGPRLRDEGIEIDHSSSSQSGRGPIPAAYATSAALS